MKQNSASDRNNSQIGVRALCVPRSRLQRARACVCLCVFSYICVCVYACVSMCVSKRRQANSQAAGNVRIRRTVYVPYRRHFHTVAKSAPVSARGWSAKYNQQKQASAWVCTAGDQVVELRARATCMCVRLPPCTALENTWDTARTRAPQKQCVLTKFYW